MRIDPEKIQNKITELNNQGGSWQEIEGNNALTKVEFSDSGTKFYPSSGVPVKMFVNRISGEIKLFPAFIFKLDNE